MARPKIITGLGPDPNSGTDDALYLLTVDARYIGLSGQPVADSQTGQADVNTALRYVDSVTKPEDTVLYHTEIHDISKLLARAGL